MTCPSCGTTAEPAAQARNVAVCSACAETVALNPAGPQKAAYADVQSLSVDEFTTLRKAKAAVVRAKANA